jgi:hypothetical protein
MDFIELISNSISNLIAAVPQLVVVLGTVLYYLGKVKNETAKFPDNLSNVQTILTNKFNGVASDMTNAFNSFGNELKIITKNAATQISAEVTGTLKTMQAELNNYHAELQSTREQSNLMVQQNKVYMDIITLLVSADPQKIKDGVAQAIASRVNLSKEEFEKYPELLVNNINQLKQALIETTMVAGKEALDELFRSLGYERKENKL